MLKYLSILEYPSIYIPLIAAIVTVGIKFLLKGRWEKEDLFIGPQLMIASFVVLLFYYVNNNNQKKAINEHNLIDTCSIVEKSDCHVLEYFDSHVTHLEVCLGNCFVYILVLIVFSFISLIALKQWGMGKETGKDSITTRGVAISLISGIGHLFYITYSLIQ